MLIKKDEADHMYCPFKFSKPASKDIRANKSRMDMRRYRLYGMANSRGI